MRTGTAPPPTGGSYSPVAPFIQPGAPKARRQPALLALGIALIGVSAAGFVYWNQQVGAKSSVLVLARDVPYGQKLTAADLRTVQMTVPDGVNAVGSSSQDIVLTEVATTQLHAGSVLTAADVGHAPPIPAGNSVVAVKLKADTLPVGLAPGRTVTLIANGVVLDVNAKSGTPVIRDNVGADVAAGTAKQITFTATIVSIVDTKVTLAVPQEQAPVIEEFADEGRIGVVLLQSGS